MSTLSSKEYDIKYRNSILQHDGSYIDKHTTTWYNQFGEYHRVEGPAIIYNNPEPNGPNAHWCHNGTFYPFAGWCYVANISEETKLLLRLQYG